MKKVISLAVITTMVIFGCNSQTPKSETAQIAEVKTEVKSNVDGKPIKLNKQQFLDQIMDYENSQEWNYKGELPGLIDFYADWCRPCKMTSPILDELAAEYAGKITIYKIDIQVEQELASVFGIQSIPAFLYIPKGERPVMSAGIAQTPEETKAMFKKQIDEILLSANTPVE